MWNTAEYEQWYPDGLMSCMTAIFLVCFLFLLCVASKSLTLKYTSAILPLDGAANFKPFSHSKFMWFSIESTAAAEFCAAVVTNSFYLFILFIFFNRSSEET